MDKDVTERVGFLLLAVGVLWLTGAPAKTVGFVLLTVAAMVLFEVLQGFITLVIEPRAEKGGVGAPFLVGWTLVLITQTLTIIAAPVCMVVAIVYYLPWL